MFRFSSPKTWEELVSLKDSIVDNPGVYRRTFFKIFIYILYLYLVPKKFRYNKIIRQIDNKQYVLAPNNFPYNKLLKNLPLVKQYCLWSSVGPLSPSKIEEIIRSAHPHSHFFWYVNQPEYRSFPEIWHCHVFVNVL